MLLLWFPAALIATSGRWEGRILEHLKRPSGVVAVRRDGAALVDAWLTAVGQREPLWSIQPGAWFWDQAALLAACQRSGVAYAELPIGRFADLHLSGPSVIWSAHLPDKGAHLSAFRGELDRMRRARRTGIG